jgi:hypothetical protein
MKKILIAIWIVLAVSCSESFDPYGDLKERYVLNCIIRGDTTFQTATLSRTYMVSNNDPYSSNIDPALKNAIIRIWNGDSVIIMRDTVVAREPESKYKYPYRLYYTNKFVLNTEKELEIEARLENGIKLKSYTLPPPPVQFSYIDKNIPYKNKESAYFLWNTGIVNQSYVTRLSIYYLKKVNGIDKFMMREIPLRYEKFGNSLVPIFPKVTNNNFLSVGMDAITETMRLISEGDDNKGNYEIMAAFLEVIVLDKNLSAYFNATARNLDNFSVKLDETDFSNIENGFGLFGIYLRNSYLVPFTPQYIKSFGYKPGLGYADYPFENRNR